MRAAGRGGGRMLRAGKPGPASACQVCGGALPEMLTETLFTEGRPCSPETAFCERGSSPETAERHARLPRRLPCGRARARARGKCEGCAMSGRGRAGSATRTCWAYRGVHARRSGQLRADRVCAGLNRVKSTNSNSLRHRLARTWRVRFFGSCRVRRRGVGGRSRCAAARPRRDRVAPQPPTAVGCIKTSVTGEAAVHF